MTPEQYEAKKQARIDRLEERAAKKRAEGEARMQTASQFFYELNGQPILVGHYSERSDRNRRERYDNMGIKGYQQTKEADRLEQRAAAARSNRAISSDDPEAVRKLQARIDEAERYQEQMKQVNAIIRSKPKNEPTPEKIEKLTAMGISEATARASFEPDFCGRIGFPAYALQNNNANIRRMKERIEELRTAPAEATEEEHEGFTVVQNTDDNRIQLIFPGKPDEATRATLKRYGFRWAPSQGAWQRQLNANGIYAAKQVTQALA